MGATAPHSTGNDDFSLVDRGPVSVCPFLVSSVHILKLNGGEVEARAKLRGWAGQVFCCWKWCVLALFSWAIWITESEPWFPKRRKTKGNTSQEDTTVNKKPCGSESLALACPDPKVHFVFQLCWTFQWPWDVTFLPFSQAEFLSLASEISNMSFELWQLRFSSLQDFQRFSHFSSLGSRGTLPAPVSLKISLQVVHSWITCSSILPQYQAQHGFVSLPGSSPCLLFLHAVLSSAIPPPNGHH
jgi:hypothetical protein